MKRSHRRLDALLDELYARIPSVPCRGLCWPSCTVVPMTARERARVAEHGVVVPPVVEALAGGSVPSCPPLTAEGRCQVYPVRPTLCRLFGVAEGLPCPHGCEPEAVLSDADAMAVLAGVEAVGGAVA